MSIPDPQTQLQAQNEALVAANQALIRANELLETQLKECAIRVKAANDVLNNEISKRKRAEEALQDAERKFRAIAQSANDAIIAADSQGRITFWNRGAQTIFGYSEAEALGQSLVMLMPAHYKDAHQSGLARVQATGESHLIGKTVEMQGLRKSNHEFPLELSLTSWLTDAGPSFSGIIHDITERKQAEQLLAEQDHLLRTLIDSLPDYIYVRDTQNGLVLNNIAHVRIWGDNGSNGDNSHESVDDFSRGLAAQYYAREQEVIRTGQPLTKEETLVDPEGRKHWLLTTTMPLRDGHGQITALVGVSRDITERKQAEKALAEERNLLRTLIDNLPDYIYVKDAQGRFLLVNEAMRRHLGAGTVEEVIGKRDSNFSPLDLATQYEADEERLFQSGQSLIGHEEPIFDHATKTQRWVLTTKVPFCDGQGQMIGLVGMNRDITELRQTQEAYRMLVQYSLQGLAILQDFHIVFANPALAEISGYTIRELLSLSPAQIQQLVHPEDQELVFGHLQNCLTGRRTPIHFAFRFIRKDGGVRWVEKYASRVEYQGREAIQIAYLDVTERKQVEEEKARLLEAVSQQRAELHALARRLAEVQEGERQQLARELHDQVGQNLSALSFNLNFVQTQISPAAPKAALLMARLNDSLALVEQTTERVRDVMAELRPPMLDDYGLVDTLDWYAGRFAARAGLSIAVQGQSITPRLAPAVENALFRVAQEALINVAKHAQATCATLSLAADDQTVRLVIADDGIGFESNGAGRAAKRKGWGLRLMSERAEMVGGRCWIESHPGGGTRVFVEVRR